MTSPANIEIIPIECNYFVLDTGYTSRLVDNENFDLWLQAWCSDVSDDEYNDENRDKSGDHVELLFVIDHVCGKGFYNLGQNQKEVDRLVDILKSAGKYKDGIACFRGKLFYCLNFIETISYCCIYDLGKVELCECGKDKIIIFKYYADCG